ncbi:MAG: 7-carboxy-7-deazaguanine synthase QueE [Chromatiales bacterium]|nr:7-carboxy-7-deazaguanine synthase QueE [Chromatiales bacterium]
MSRSAGGEDRLKITEIFYSLQGESRTVGLPTVFIRLTGCPLRCTWCDTEYAFHGGEWMDFDAILARVAEYPTPHVTVTGGEPLAQRRCLVLLRRLCEAGYQVSLETSGALDVSEVDERVVKVMDLKPPGSGEHDRNHWENLQSLNPRDQVKFVVADRGDYDWSVDQMGRHDLAKHCEVLFSPVQGRLAPSQLADWILADRLPVRFQLQLHKLLWGDQPGK